MTNLNALRPVCLLVLDGMVIVEQFLRGFLRFLDRQMREILELTSSTFLIPFHRSASRPTDMPLLIPKP